jgi:hypothetical protein
VYYDEFTSSRLPADAKWTVALDTVEKSYDRRMYILQGTELTVEAQKLQTVWVAGNTSLSGPIESLRRRK